MAYVSAEQTEEPAKNEHQYIPASLPAFKKQDNPLANIQGTEVFCQDEGSKISGFKFAVDPAAAILMGEVETCRQSHQGHVLRQRVTVERCSLVEYHYRHGGKTHSIFLNPTHNLVEDLAGPVQEAIENMDALAQKAFDKQRYEEAYRLNLRTLCMDEATDAEKSLRDEILKRLTRAYRNPALLTWLVCTVLWLAIGAVWGRFNFGAALGLIPLLAGVRLFSRDAGLRFQHRSSRLMAAGLIGFGAFLSGMGVSSESLNPDNEFRWTGWLPVALVTTALIVVAAARAEERARRSGIEKRLKSFPNVQALEVHVCRLDPTSGFEFKSVLGLAAGTAALAALLGSLAMTTRPPASRLHEVAFATGHNKPVKTLAMNPQGTVLLSFGLDGAIKLRDVPTGANLRSIASLEPGATVRSVSFSPDGRRVAWGASPESPAERNMTHVTVFDLEHNQVAFNKTYAGSWQIVGPVVTFSASGELSAFMSKGGRADAYLGVWWYSSTGEEVRSVRLPSMNLSVVFSAAVSPAGDWVAAGAGADGTILLISVSDSSFARDFKDDRFSYHDPAFSGDGRIVSALGYHYDEEATVRLWDAATGSQRCSMPIAGPVTVYAYAVSSDTRCIAIGSSKGFSLWDTGRSKFLVRNRAPEAKAVAFSADGRSVAAAGTNDTIRLWTWPN